MAAVYRDEPSIVIPEGIALDIGGMEVKNDDGTREDCCGMEAKSDKEKATQAGVCHMGKEGSVLRCQTDEEQVSPCEMEDISEEGKAAQTEVCKPREEPRYNSSDGALFRK